MPAGAEARRVVNRRRAARLLARLPRVLWRRAGIDLVPMGRDLRLIHGSRLFDPAWYLATYPDVDRAAMDPLVHYVCFGGFEGRWPNRYFDSGWYIEQHGLALTGDQNPLAHYVSEGAARGLATCADFDTRYYVEANPDVAGTGINPLLHFITHGRGEGRRGTRAAERAKPGRAPEAALWDELAKTRPVPRNPGVDVIVPVYRGHDETLACLHSVLSAHVAIAHEVVVIDDYSPEPRLSEALRDLAARGLITLLRNETNLGFVRTANRGMALHTARDVVLLNADTEVHDGWLDRLAAHVKGQVGTITPFSNNATICSYPVFNRDNDAPFELSFAELDGLFAKANAGRSVEIPTAVGFCMYITRACLQATGSFDAETFGRGYGEENDFCRRAAALGFRHLLAGDVFVRHLGAVSFAGDAPKHLKAALDAMRRKHPGYFDLVRRHMNEDPARPLRRAVDEARLARWIGPGATGHISHNWSGGISRHVADVVAGGGQSGQGNVILAPGTGERGRLALNVLPRLDVPGLQNLSLDAGEDDAAAVLAGLGLGRLVVHSLAGWPVDAATRMRALAERAGLAYDFVLHDYLAFCPRINLLGSDGLYCGEPGEEACRRCLARNGSPSGVTDISKWREGYRQMLDGATQILAPSHDAAQRAERYLGGRKVATMPHRENLEAFERVAVRRRADETLRVIVVGAIGPHKGSAVLLAMAGDAVRRRLPVHFTVIGHTDRDREFLGCENVTVTGRYEEPELPALLARHAGHLAFLPSVWPETYSYTLSACLASGYPVAAFDIGAIAERLKALDAARLLMPLGLARNPQAINGLLMSWRVEGDAA